MIVGIYGGTFSPIHYGHIKSARAFKDQCNLDKLFIVPSAIPPHKMIDASDEPEKRLEMVKLAFGDQEKDNIFVSDFEINRKGISYTINTLKHYKKLYGAELIFLCGADMFVTLDKWHKADEIFKISSIAYANRDNIDISSKAEYYKTFFNADLIEIGMEPIDISSTELRDMIAADRDVSQYIPENIIRYIRKNNLYGEITG